MKKITHRTFMNGALALAVAATLLTGCKTSSPATKLTATEATQLGTDAYIFGYPLVTMEYTRRVLTNVRGPMGLRAPAGQFGKAREYPNASFRDVTAPNADTLYTTTWLDVS